MEREAAVEAPSLFYCSPSRKQEAPSSIIENISGKEPLSVSLYDRPR